MAETGTVFGHGGPHEIGLGFGQVVLVHECCLDPYVKKEELVCVEKKREAENRGWWGRHVPKNEPQSV